MISAAIVGIVVGILSGLLGIGGGTVMVPVFRLLFGMEPIMATATSFFTIIPTSLAGMWKHIRNRTCLLKLGLIAGIAGACMSPVGVWCANVSPGWLIMIAAACVILYSAFTMLKKAIAAGKPRKDAASRSGAPLVSDDVAPLSARQVALGAAIGLAAGFLGGFVGVGGGFIMVPLFISLLGVSMRLASGTSLIAVLLIAIPGTIEQGILGNISYTAGLAMAVGSMPGAVLGANLIKYVPERALRFGFAGFLAVVAVILVLNEFGVLG